MSMKITGKFDVVRAVKENSREMFRNMPKMKRVGDKRFKKPKYRERYDD